ncbi:MAG: universal stress protein [Deltaproteobacteria bacterium]|nr:universal stress protein [Deltaproteobacteria bacterium]MBW1718094.1 universal stress protein [Deltaproteobacteria bacterium]MBW1932209.1 universal stress protein [Deltaproteobacteria bacterium]MBW1964615.1 universal stress protein [Deltaproteobacteria bacterium]MBW2079955.1 universal stress protein [Deltaproteobacteria bacterium]
MEHGACSLTRGEKLLVALDGSEHAYKALDQAISLAKVCNSSIFLISVLDLYPGQMELAPLLEEKLSAKIHETLEKGKEIVEKENLSCETIVHMGGTAHEFIVKEAKERGIDLIVMGSHGRTGLSKMMVGSVTERVIGHAPCAVMVTPK